MCMCMCLGHFLSVRKKGWSWIVVNKECESRVKRWPQEKGAEGGSPVLMCHASLHTCCEVNCCLLLLLVLSGLYT
jgi:hypothetical protein